MHDPRVISAARYWATRPGNYTLSCVFDEDDARQEAAIALLSHVDATWSILYRRVIDAARRTVPGYRQRLMPRMTPLDDDRVTDCQAERLTLLHERAAIIDALPEDEKAVVLHWVLGDTDTEAGALYGVKESAWCKRRTKVFQRLQKRGL